MTEIVQEPRVDDRLIRERRERGLDRHDEVWEGVYLIMPDPNNEHQSLVARLTTILTTVLDFDGRGSVFPGVNVTDQSPADWESNYRCPDVAVYLNESTAEDRGTHWFGGPDFAVEIVSPNDRSREKLGFYGSVGTRELLIVDRDPWSLELFRLDGSAMRSVGRSTLDDPRELACAAIPFTWQLAAGTARPAIRVLGHADDREWIV